MASIMRSTRLEIVRRALDESREALAGLPLTPEVKALQDRVTAAEAEAANHESGVTSTRRRERLVREALILTLEALQIARTLRRG
jgi:hypothetical protein